MSKKSSPAAKAKGQGLQDLDTLKAALRKASAELARTQFEAREQAMRLAHEHDLFARSVGNVEPLRVRLRIRLERPRPEPIPRQREQDEAAVLREAISDDFDAGTLLDSDDSLSFRRSDVGPEVVRKLRRGVWVIQAQVDLHGLRRDEARDRLVEFVRKSHQQGLRCIRVIHGKGNGSPGREPVLKDKAKRWLAQSQAVVAFTQARPSDGGQGALVVLLRGRKHTS